jgi:PII-like signaling protein
LNGYFKHKKIHQYTWQRDTLEPKSIIDYIITEQNSDLKYEDVTVFRGVTAGSDRYLVNAKFLFPYGKQQCK